MGLHLWLVHPVWSWRLFCDQTNNRIRLCKRPRLQGTQRVYRFLYFLWVDRGAVSPLKWVQPHGQTCNCHEDVVYTATAPRSSPLISHSSFMARAETGTSGASGGSRVTTASRFRASST